jgi:lipopolysaccharide export system permease protein
VRIINRYITFSFLLAFLVALAVFTFVMCIGLILKATDLLARGVDWRPILKIALTGIPDTLVFSFPLSSLVGTLLIFGRLSADGEIVAMKVCGIGMWKIAGGPLLISLCLVAVCLHIHNELAPNSHFARRSIKAELGVASPVEILDEGRFIQDFPGLTIYIGQKRGARLQNIRIYDLRMPNIKREIRAESGLLRAADDGRDVVVDLFDVRVDPFSEDRPGAAYCERLPIRIENALQKRVYDKRPRDMVVAELIEGWRHPAAVFPELDPQGAPKQKAALAVELHKRLALSVSCFSFVLLGIPLGIKGHRKESSIGVAMGLFLVFNFYLFIIVAESLKTHPEWRPHLIVWIPVVASLFTGLRLMHRAD